ncbi:hypothetical protein KM043_006745 [Ampulex compressa]|nr:hypothetical protein KM043_006745 [Ampulex compressa]
MGNRGRVISRPKEELPVSARTNYSLAIDEIAIPYVDPFPARGQERRSAWLLGSTEEGAGGHCALQGCSSRL